MLCRGAVSLTIIAWCLFAPHNKLGNLLTFIGGCVYGILFLIAALVSAHLLHSLSAKCLPSVCTVLGQLHATSRTLTAIYGVLNTLKSSCSSFQLCSLDNFYACTGSSSALYQRASASSHQQSKQFPEHSKPGQGCIFQFWCSRRPS